MSAGFVVTAVGLVVFGYLIGLAFAQCVSGQGRQGHRSSRSTAAGTQVPPTPSGCWGSAWGVTVLVLDILKGVIPVVLARYLSNPTVTVLVAFAAVIGHNFSIFLKGAGGKGVATGAGAAIGMIPLPMACLVGAFRCRSCSPRASSLWLRSPATIALPILAGLLYRYGTGVWATPLPYVVACCLMAGSGALGAPQQHEATDHGYGA